MSTARAGETALQHLIGHARAESVLHVAESVLMAAVLVLLPIRAATPIASGTVNYGFILALAAMPLILPKALARFEHSGLWASSAIAILFAPISVAVSMSMGRGFEPTAALTELLFISKSFVLVLSILWARTRFSPPVVAIFLAAGLAIHYLSQPSSFDVNPWKYAFSTPVAILALALASLSGRLWPSYVVAIALMGATAGSGYRSFIGIVGFAVLASVFAPRLIRSRVSLKKIAVGAVVVGFCLYQAVIGLAVSGALGERNQRVTTEQLAQGASLISAGRPEWNSTLALFPHSPLGFGPGVLPSAADIGLGISALSRAGVDTSTTEVRSYMFGGGLELHSVAMDLWVRLGAGGLLVALVLGVIVVKGAYREASLVRPWLPLTAFLAVLAIWDLLFSPLETNLIEVCFAAGMAIPARFDDGTGLTLPDTPFLLRPFHRIKARFSKPAQIRPHDPDPTSSDSVDAESPTPTHMALRGSSGASARQAEPKEKSMDLLEYLLILRRRWLSTLVCILVGAAAAIGVFAVSVPTYSATTSLLLTVTTGTSAGELYQSSAYARSQALNYVHLVGSAAVLQPTASELNPPADASALASDVTANVTPDTSIINITVTAPDAGRCAEIANALGDQLSGMVTSLSPQSNGSSPVHLTTINPAVVPSRPGSPNLPKLLMVGLGIGVALGVAQAIARATLPGIWAALRDRSGRATIDQ